MIDAPLCILVVRLWPLGGIGLHRGLVMGRYKRNLIVVISQNRGTLPGSADGNPELRIRIGTYVLTSIV